MWTEFIRTVSVLVFGVTCITYNVSCDEIRRRTELGQRAVLLCDVQSRYPEMRQKFIMYEEGSKAEFKCCVQFGSSNGDQLAFEWYIDKEPLTLGKTSTNMNVTSLCSETSFHAERWQNNKSVACLLRNELNITLSSSLNVLYSASVQYDSSWPNGTSTHSCVEGEALTITCEADGNPKPNVSIERYLNNDWRILNHEDTIASKNGWKITCLYRINNVSRDDAGKYRCTSMNEISPRGVSDSVYIDVMYPVTVQMTSPEVVNMKEGTDFFIECCTDSNPTPTVTLQKIVNVDHWASLLIVPSASIASTQTNWTWRFEFTNVTKDYEGTYKCSAFNGFGVPMFSSPSTLRIEHLSKWKLSIIILCILTLIVCILCGLKYWKKRYSATDIPYPLRYHRYGFNRSTRNTRNYNDTTVSSSFKAVIVGSQPENMKLQNTNDTLYQDITTADKVQFPGSTQHDPMSVIDDDIDDSSFDESSEYMAETGYPDLWTPIIPT
ncbi:hypothetical protein BSL78_02068 [Apostichopus japonicus]|uniref:Ig-like domain-containing protein n=1 Tax=Stichopus japonicus TaxID=307972 RepID=A0A2G8LL77_STIJA|nr:hypothetical protein BSL78_02068 [Apostichopus japonicus]